MMIYKPNAKRESIIGALEAQTLMIPKEKVAPFLDLFNQIRRGRTLKATAEYCDIGLASYYEMQSGKLTAQRAKKILTAWEKDKSGRARREEKACS